MHPNHGQLDVIPYFNKEGVLVPGRRVKPLMKTTVEYRYEEVAS
jgi:hypothetical protein